MQLRKKAGGAVPQRGPTSALLTEGYQAQARKDSREMKILSITVHFIVYPHAQNEKQAKVLLAI